MNINPLPYDERERMIAELANGLGNRAHITLRGLSDGALRSIHYDWQQVEAAQQCRAKILERDADALKARVDSRPTNEAPAWDLQTR